MFVKFILFFLLFGLIKSQISPSGQNCISANATILSSDEFREHFFSWTVMDPSDPLSDVFMEVIVTNAPASNWNGIAWRVVGPAYDVQHAGADYIVAIDTANPVGFTAVSENANTQPVESTEVDNLISNRMNMQIDDTSVMSFTYSLAGTVNFSLGDQPGGQSFLNTTSEYQILYAAALNNVFLQHNGIRLGSRGFFSETIILNETINTCMENITTNGSITAEPSTTTTSIASNLNPITQIIFILFLIKFFVFFMFF